MYLSADEHVTWPESMAFIGMLLAIILLVGFLMASYVELRKARLAASQRDDLQRLVQRYEQLAENTLDLQKRVSVDLSELRSRTASIEKILRTVE
jgi:type VI protein secretion system component VasK